MKAAYRYQGNQAPDGIVGPYWQPEPSYYAVRDIWSPVTVPVSPIASGSTVLSSTFNGQIGVHNDYFFTSLSACTFTWQVEDFPLLASGHFDGPDRQQQRQPAGPAVAPQTTGTLQLNLPGGWASHGALQLTAYNWNGQFLDHMDVAHPVPGGHGKRRTCRPPRARHGGDLRHGHRALGLDDAGSHQHGPTGLISTVVANGTRFPSPMGRSLASRHGRPSRSMSVAQSGSNQVVTANFTGNLQTITYTMRGDGWMKVIPPSRLRAPRLISA